MPIGICGGTFDPIHKGHLTIAGAALKQLGLSRVLFIPNGNPPHKEGAVAASASDRMEMVRLAVADNPCFYADDREMRPGIVYAVDTLSQLREENPYAVYYYIVGGDTLPELVTWRRFETLCTLCRFAVYPREGFDAGTIRAEAQRLHDRFGLAYELLEGPRVDLTSTGIREWAAIGISLKYLVPGSVCRYIGEHGLYAGKSA